MKITIEKKHLDLLKEGYVSTYECEFGGIGLDCKRPFGNSTVIYDMLEILDIIQEGYKITSFDGVENIDALLEQYQIEFDEDGWVIEDCIYDVNDMLCEYYYSDMVSLYSELETVIQIIFQNPCQDILNKTFYKENSWDSVWKEI